MLITPVLSCKIKIIFSKEEREYDALLFGGNLT